MSVIKITADNFKQEVMESDKPVLIDFWAAWCNPCKMLSPVVDEIAEEVTNVKVCKVNVDDEAELASQFHVMSIPTLVYMKNGQVVSTSMGVQAKKQILKMISQ